MSAIYTPGNEPENIKKRLDRFFEKLDSAYPDKIVKSLHKDHKKWGETLTKLYRELGYESGNALLEAYGYTVAASDNKGGRTSAMSVDEVIAEFKSRYKDGPQYDNIKDLLSANADIAPYCRKVQNNSNELFGMPFGPYLISIGVLKKKEYKEKEALPPIEERFDGLIEQLQARYKNSINLPRNILELKKQCSDLDVSHIESWALKSYNVSAERYLTERGILKTISSEKVCAKKTISHTAKVSLKENTKETISKDSDYTVTTINSKLTKLVTLQSKWAVSKNIKTIGNFALNACPNLKVLTIHSGVRFLNDSLTGCLSLKTIVLEEGVSTINEKALRNGKIKEVVFADGRNVKILDDYFYDCIKETDKGITFSYYDIAKMINRASTLSAKFKIAVHLLTEHTDEIGDAASDIMEVALKQCIGKNDVDTLTKLLNLKVNCSLNFAELVDIAHRANNTEIAAIILGFAGNISRKNIIKNETPAESGPRLHIRVGFEDNKAYSYFCSFIVKVGDKVFVGGKKAGMPGEVLEILKSDPKGTAAFYTQEVVKAFNVEIDDFDSL